MSAPGRFGPRLSVLACLLLLVLETSCAVFRGDELPRRGFREAVGDERLPAVSYTMTSAFAALGMNASRQSLTVERVFRRAFVEVHLVEPEPPPSGDGLRLDLHCTSRTRSPTFTLGLTLVSVLTLGILPAYERDDHRLEVLVRTGDRIAKRYEYEDHLYGWLHLFMIPWAFSHDPVEMEDDLWENMLLNFLYDYRRDLPELEAAGSGT